MGGHPDLTVVTPVWRGSKEGGAAVLGLAESLRATARTSYELVVVENGARAPENTLANRRISFQHNAGVPNAWNAGAEAGKGEFLAFINDDVIVGAGCLDTLVGVLRKHPEVGVVGPSGSRWDSTVGRHCSYVEGEGRVECDVVSGFLFVTRRECWETVGGFDSRYTPCSFEEVDYCFAVRDLGWRCEAVSPLSYSHEWGISRARPYRRIRYQGRSESIRSINRRNRALLISKWGQ